MMLRQFDPRQLGSLLALAVWLVLVSDPCLDVGTVHAPIRPISAHVGVDLDEGHVAVHAECVWALFGSADQNPWPGRAGVDPTGLLVLAAPSFLVGAPVPVQIPSADVTSGSAVPLYLLHAVLLI